MNSKTRHKFQWNEKDHPKVKYQQRKSHEKYEANIYKSIVSNVIDLLYSFFHRLMIPVQLMKAVNIPTKRSL